MSATTVSVVDKRERGGSREQQKEFLVTLKQLSKRRARDRPTIKGVLLRLLSSENSLYKEDVYNQRQEEQREESPR